MCGPQITGLAKNAGSRILWPPRAASVPPMNTTSAREKQAASSPMESSSRHAGQLRAGLAASERRTKRMPAAASLAATDVEAFRLARGQQQQEAADAAPPVLEMP